MKRTGLLAAALALACAGASHAADQIGYAGPDGTNTVPVSKLTPLPTTTMGVDSVTGQGCTPGSAPTCAGGGGDSRSTASLALASLNAAVSAGLNNGQAVTGFDISGLTGSGAILTFQASTDGGLHWRTVKAASVENGFASTTAVDGAYRLNSGARTSARVVVSAVGSGSATVAINASSASSEPLDPNNAAFSGFTDMPADGAAYAAGRSFEAECSAAGKVKVTATDGTTRTLTVAAGDNIRPYAVTAWTLTGVTGAAACTYANLK